MKFPARFQTERPVLQTARSFIHSSIVPSRHFNLPVVSVQPCGRGRSLALCLNSQKREEKKEKMNQNQKPQQARHFPGTSLPVRAAGRPCAQLSPVFCFPVFSATGREGERSPLLQWGSPGGLPAVEVRGRRGESPVRPRLFPRSLVNDRLTESSG